MNGRLLFDVRHGFGKLELLREDGSTDLAGIPSELIERPDVLRALLAIAENGGKQLLARTEISEVLVVDGNDIYRTELDA